MCVHVSALMRVHACVRASKKHISRQGHRKLRLEQSLLGSRQGLQSLLLHPGILLPVQVTPVAELLLERVSRDIIVHLHHLGEVKLDKLCNQD